MNRRWLGVAVAVSALGGCGEDGGRFDEEAAIVALRPGWPGMSDNDLVEKADVFRDSCNHDPDDRTDTVVFVLSLKDPDLRRILEAGCPDRVVEVDAEFGR